MASKQRPQALITILQLFRTLWAPPPVSQIAPSYHAVREAEILRLLAKHLGKNPNHPGILLGQRLLDVGCGTAPLGCFFVLSGAEVTAIDPNRQALATAANYAQTYGTTVNFMPLKAEDFLATGERFNIVLALDVLTSARNPGKLVWVLRQLLAEGGVLMIGHTTRSLRAWLVHSFFSQRLFKRIKNRPADSWQALHTPAQLAELAAAAGLKPAGHTLLRYSVNGSKWKVTTNRHIFTRYLAAFKV